MVSIDYINAFSDEERGSLLPKYISRVEHLLKDLFEECISKKFILVEHVRCAWVESKAIENRI